MTSREKKPEFMFFPFIKLIKTLRLASQYNIYFWKSKISSGKVVFIRAGAFIRISMVNMPHPNKFMLEFPRHLF